ncbi:MAG: PAS domain S-box protein [Alphaproteobacteria bacterium]|nr:PAS domain S-box protein [Alphaproteobacteria bacterium]
MASARVTKFPGGPKSVPEQGQVAPEVAPVPAPAMVGDRRRIGVTEAVGDMGHFLWRVETGQVSWSPQLFQIFGVRPAEFEPNFERAVAFIHADDQPVVRAELDRAIGAKASFEIDFRIIRPDGAIRHLIACGQPEAETGARAGVMVGIVTDVTDALSAVRATQDRNEMLDLVAEVTHLGHWVWSAADGHMTHCSDELARIHDMSPVVFKTRFPDPRAFAGVVANRDREAYRSAIEAALTDARAYRIDYELETRFGTTKHIREIGQPIFDSIGRFSRFVASVQDVTETKRRELLVAAAKTALEAQTDALKRSETRFRDMIEGSIQGILVMRGRRPLFANHAFARLIGAAATEEVIALDDIEPLVVNHTDFDALFRPNAKAGLQRLALRTIDRRTVWIDAVGRVAEWDGAPARLLTAIDVTDRHAAEEAIRQKNAELEQLNLQKDKLFSIIAHDLKGPFNGVLGFAGLLAAKAKSLPPEKNAEYASLIYDAATGVNDLLDNLLAWASVQMRDAALRTANISLSAVVDASLYPLRAMGVEKGVEVNNRVGDLAVEADENMIRIVLRNLMSNGIKFTPAGGAVTITAEQIGTGGGPRRMIEISVRDSGVGMTPEFAAELFNIGRKVSMAGTRGERGTGLGLLLCRDIIARHGGTFTVDSAVGRGTAFRFTLPVAL